MNSLAVDTVHIDHISVLILLYPAGGERFVQGQNVQVRWVGIELDSRVQVELWDG